MPEKKWIENWFSNFIPFEKPLVFEGITFRTPEAFFQAMKLESVADREQVASMPPGPGKRFARRRPLRADWEHIKRFVMELAIRHKFAPGTKAFDMLMATGSEEIVEWNNWGDTTWGRDVETGRGLNLLGELLMKLRAEHKAAIQEPKRFLVPKPPQ